MTQKSTGIILVVCLIALGFGSAFFLNIVLSRPKQVPSTHQTIINNCQVTAMLTSGVTTQLTPVLRDADTEKQVTALSIVDISRRAQWYGQSFQFSEWAWEYKDHPLAYLKIWGPRENVFYIEFSRASMTTITLTVYEETATFPSTTQDPPISGFYWTWIDTTP